MAGKTKAKTAAEETIAKGRQRHFKRVETPAPDAEQDEAAPPVEPGEAPPAAERPRGPRKPACRVRASALRAALKDVLGAISGRSEIPILSHVLLQVGDGRIALTATDLDVWIERDCATDDRDGPGSAEWVKGIRGFAAALPAKPLGAILGEFDADAMVTLEAPETADTASDARLTISAGRSRFKLNQLPANDFPPPMPMEVGVSFSMPCTALADAFARVEHAISAEETRYYLNGVFLHIHQAEGAAEPAWMHAAATDGHRLARLRFDPPDGAAAWPAAIVHRTTVALLDKLLGAAARTEAKDRPPPPVTIECDDSSVPTLRLRLPAADGGDIVVTAKTINGTFPDYARVIPADPPHAATCDRGALLDAVRRVGVLTSDKTRAVKAVFGEDSLELVVTTPELGEAREELECTYAGPPMTLGFNGQYWREALGALACDEISMAFFDDTAAPVLVRASGDSVDGEMLVQVLMPMRVA